MPAKEIVLSSKPAAGPIAGPMIAQSAAACSHVYMQNTHRIGITGFAWGWIGQRKCWMNMNLHAPMLAPSGVM